MRTAFITRSTLHEVPGGDTIQVIQTAKHLEALGHEVDIRLTHEKINYAEYDLLHFFNITRPADILYHINQTPKPFAVSPILIDYAEFDRQYRNGISGKVLRLFPAGMSEYIKTLSRWVKGSDRLRSRSYLWKGQQNSIRTILRKAAILFPNSQAEYERLKDLYPGSKAFSIVPNGVDPGLFHSDPSASRDDKLVVCAARIEGIKNQLNLIKALNGTGYTLVIIGAAAPNQTGYYKACRRMASKNILFHDRLPQHELVNYYQAAKVHALPSWYETCGLSSLEAGVMGCNLAISEKGYTRDYFGNDAFYADPGNAESIYQAIDSAARHPFPESLRQRILTDYTWQKAAAITSAAYQKIIAN